MAFSYNETHDDGVTVAAVKACGLETEFKKEMKKVEIDIDAKNLGVVFERTLTTSGDKYSFFFKYTRVGDDKADVLLLALASHSGKGNKYYEVNKKGKSTSTQISAQKKHT